MLKHSVTHNSTISQNLLKRIEKIWITGSLFHINFLIFYHFYIELCYIYSSAISTVTLFRMAYLGTLTDGGGLTYIFQWLNLAQLYLTYRRSKKYIKHVKQSLSSTGISIFSPEIGIFRYIKKYVFDRKTGSESPNCKILIWQ